MTHARRGLFIAGRRRRWGGGGARAACLTSARAAGGRGHSRPGYALFPLQPSHPPPDSGEWGKPSRARWGRRGAVAGAPGGGFPLLIHPHTGKNPTENKRVGAGFREAECPPGAGGAAVTQSPGPARSSRTVRGPRRQLLNTSPLLSLATSPRRAQP